MQSEILQLYWYIKHCLYKHLGNLPKTANPNLKDMQHDIFLYMVEIKGINEFNSGSRRFAYLLAQYRPQYLRRYVYHKKAEQVLIDTEGNPIEAGLSSFADGEAQHDLNFLGALKKQKKFKADGSNHRSILVTDIHGNAQLYESIRSLCREIGCHESTVNIWIRKGMPTRKWGKLGEHKYRHIVKIEYMVKIQNPLNGNKLNITKRITLNEWQKYNKEEWSLHDSNEFLELWENKENGEGLWVSMPADKENKYIKKLAKH